MTTQRIDVEHHQTDADTPSATVRGWAKLVVFVGAVACVTPWWPLGAGMVAVGLYLWPSTHVVEPVEVKAIAAAETTGGGCGWVLLAALLIVIVALLGVALLGAVVESGVIR